MSGSQSIPRLSRTALRGAVAEPPPVRVLHLGLGIFHRTHQAWYTHRANRAGDRPAGIAAFTGRRPDAARPLHAQDGLYHLLVRGAGGDEVELIESIVSAADGGDAEAWKAHWASPSVECVTLTVTEAGYRRRPDGAVDLDGEDLAADLEHLRSGRGTVATAPARLVAGLVERRAADAGPIAIVPCDNITDNGPALRAVISALAEAIDPTLYKWIEEHVSFVGTMVDRITPKTTEEDIEAVRAATGYDDHAPVVAEPFTEWVLAGDFPAGRPQWELAGARFVNDVRPFEQRKLWLLNGAHSLLAYAGPARGHETVAEAMADAECRRWLEAWWDEACRHLSLPGQELADYCTALTERFCNPAIRHRLAQIQADGSQKLPIRTLPVLARERANGALPLGGVTAIAGWLAHLRGGTDVNDPRAAELVELAGNGSPESAARRVLAAIAPTSGLADDAELVRAIARHSRDLAR